MEVLQSVTAVQRWFRALYRPQYAPNRNIHRKFIKTESVMDGLRSGKLRSGHSKEKVAAFRKAFDLSQGNSTCRPSSELNISATSIQWILRRKRRLFPYNIQDIQKLEPQDCRVEMCETLLDHFKRDPFILELIWFRGEALFYLSGHCNRHNTRIWGLPIPRKSMSTNEIR